MKQDGKAENKVANQENGRGSHQFEPHQFKSSQCAKCFRSLAEHGESVDSVDKGLAGKVINLNTFGVQNGTLETQPGMDASAASGSSSDAAQPNNLSFDHSSHKGSRLRRQAPISKELGETAKNNLSPPKRTNNSPGQRKNIRGESSTADDACSENSSVIDNTAVQLMSYKLQSVNNLGSASQTPPSAVGGNAAKADFSKVLNYSRAADGRSEIRTQKVNTKAQNGPSTAVPKPKGQSNPALRNGTSALNSNKKAKGAVGSSVTVNLKKATPSKSGIPLRKTTEKESDAEFQRIAKNLRPVPKTTNSTTKVENKSAVPKLGKSTGVKPTAEEIVDVEERSKIVKSKSLFASETLSKTAFSVFSSGHKHDTLPKRLREPQSRPSVKPLTQEDRNNSDPELFQSVHSEEVKVVSVTESDSVNGDVTSHSQAVTSSQISSEIYFGKSPKRTTVESDQTATPGNVVIVDAAGNVSHFNTKPSVNSESAESHKSSKSTSKPLPKEKAPSSFAIPYRVVDLDGPSSCRPYKVVDIVNNPPEARPDQLDSENTNVHSGPASGQQSAPTHRDTPTKFPKPSFSFPTSTNATSQFQASASQPPFPIILHDEKVTSPKEKGYENPSKVAIYIGSGGYDNLPESGRAQQEEEEDDDLDSAIAVVSGYDNVDQMLASSSHGTTTEEGKKAEQGESNQRPETVTAEPNAVSPNIQNKEDTQNVASTPPIAGTSATGDQVNENKAKDDGSKINESKTSDAIVREIDNEEQKRTEESRKGDTLAMGYERPINVIPVSKSSKHDYYRQRSLSDPEIIASNEPEYETLTLPVSAKATSDQSLDQILDDEEEDLTPSPRRRTSSMPHKKAALGHRRERSKTVEVVPTVEAKSDLKIKPKRVAPPPPPPTQPPPPPPPPASQPPAPTQPPPPPPPATAHERSLSPTRIPELQRRSRALSPNRAESRTKAPPRHEDATADSMPRYPPPPPPPPQNNNKKMTSPPNKGVHQRALSPTRAMSPPIAISRPPEDPPRITNTPPKDEWIKPTPMMMESPQQISSSPPRTDTKMKLPKFSLRKLLVGKKREPEAPGSPTRPVNAEVVHRWLNKQSYLSDEEMVVLDVPDVPSEQSIISVAESLTSADGLNRAVMNKIEQDLAKKRRAPRKPPPPPVPSGEQSNGQSGSPASGGEVTPTNSNSPQLQKAYSLSPPSMRRLREQQQVDYENTGAARANAMSIKKPTRRDRRGRNKTTGFEDLPSRRQAPVPPGHSHTHHIYDEIPFDKKRQAPMPPGERSMKHAPAKPPRKLSFEDRLPVPAPRHKSSDDERLNEMGVAENDVEELHLFEDMEKETHLKSALKHAQPDKIDSNKAPRRPVRIVAPDEEGGQQFESSDEGISDPSYANLYTMLKQAAELAKRQGEQKRWSSSSDETIDSQKGIPGGKRPVPTPRAPVKINRSTSPIMFPGNVRDKASVFEPSTSANTASTSESSAEPPAPANSASSQASETETGQQEARLNELNLNTLKRMMTMWKIQQEEHLTLEEVSWKDLSLKSEDPRFSSADTIVYPVMHNDHQNQPLAAQICIKPENKDEFVGGIQVCRSIVPHPNIFQVTSVFTDNIPESVLGLEPASPKKVTEDEPGTSSPVEKFVEAAVVLTNREPSTQADLYIKHSKEMHEFLPQKYEHDVCLLLLQLFQGLHHLDMHHIVHGDLKTSNLFLADSKLSGGGTQLVIANFGSAKQKTDEESAEAGTESKTQEFEAGLMIYEFLHEKSPFVVKTLLITQDYNPADLPGLPQSSTYSQGLNRLAGELLRRQPSDRLSTEKAVAALQCLLWGPPGSLLRDVVDETEQERELQNWLDLERAKAVNTIAEKHLAVLFRGEQGISLEDHLHCQFLSEISISALRESYKLLND